MTATDLISVERTAARAALAVPGVAELQPTLSQSLAGAATRVRRALGSPAPSPEAGVHAEASSAGTGAWYLEVRCVVTDERRALDTARDVHDTVRAAVASDAAHHGTPVQVTVAVSVVGITGSHTSSGHPGTTAP